MLKMVSVTDVFSRATDLWHNHIPPVLLELEGSHGHHMSRRAWLCPRIYRGWHGPEWARGPLFADLGLNDKHQIIWVSL